MTPCRSPLAVLALGVVFSAGCADEESQSGEPDASGSGESDPDGCTTVGWDEGFTLSMTSPGTAYLPEGLYEFDVTADALTTSLGVRWLNELSGCKGSEADCTAELPADDGTLFVTVDPVIGAYNNERYELLGFTLYMAASDGGGPATADVVVMLDQTPIAMSQFSPSYRVWEPNGAGCGVAITADDELALDLP